MFPGWCSSLSGMMGMICSVNRVTGSVWRWSGSRGAVRHGSGLS